MSLMLAWLAGTAWGAAPGDLPAGEHARQAARPPLVAARREAAPLPTPTDGPDVRVYGYLAWWADDLQTVPWDQLSDLAVFSAGASSDGTLTDTDSWDHVGDAVAIAAPYGVRVHLCVTNFSTSSLESLLGDPDAQDRLIDALADWVDRTGAHGVNVDFEGLPASRRDEMVAFVAALDARVPDVVLATPAVDWDGAWDYSELTRHADLFIMGYGYHWSGSSYAGPVDPLYGGGEWSDKSLSWTVDDYLTYDAAPERVILGLPLYGYAWETGSDAVPAEATADGDAILWSSTAAGAAEHGARRDSASDTPWYFDGNRQVWHADVEGVRSRIRHAQAAGLGGVGFWALNYDDGDAALWQMVDEETRPALPVPDGTGFVADAGPPFLAYPGDRIILSGADSVGPDGVALQYLWTQVAGPRVNLSSDTDVQPEFLALNPGVLQFELRVGDGVTFSPAASSYVIVLNRDAGTAHQGGCAHTPAPAGLALGLAAALLARRRRR